MATTRPLAITCGEPAGIGPDICLALAAKGLLGNTVLIGNRATLESRAATLKLPCDYASLDELEAISAIAQPDRPAILDVAVNEAVQPGRLNPQNAPHVLETLRIACDGALKGQFAGIVTAPLQKSVINDAGVPFSGHTEYFAERCGSAPVMMLTGGGMRVALATTHLPLKAVADAITRDGLTRDLQILHNELLTRFGIAGPRILVCGLNPHAGENGHLGEEDEKIIRPVITALRSSGINIIGPLPADTLFTPKYLDNCDAVMAMYHDQGLPVLKHASFGEAVNVTLGLPIVRTSVDHGTALDLAGSGNASASSLEQAVRLARQLSA